MRSAGDLLAKEVCEKWDIENVSQVIDMLGLQGDTSDNIPGIPGIGPKTASELLKQYKTVEGVVEHAAELKGKQKERVEQFGEQAILSKKLATIITDVPIDFNEEALRYTGPEESLRPILEELIEIPWFTPPVTVSRRHALTHAAMHSHYHRGQNATRLRELGGAPPMTDFIIWLRNGQPSAPWS